MMTKNTNGFNPFSVLTPKLDDEALKLEGLHEKPFSEEVPPQEALLIMISKLMEMTRLLSRCIRSGSDLELDDCGILAKEVHEQEKLLTKNLLESCLARDRLRTLIRFPFRLERIGDMLESILNCCRIKAEDGIPLSGQAHEDLDKLFAIILDVMSNTRDCLIAVDRLSLEKTLSQGKELGRMLLDCRLAHWDRVEAGICAYQASSLYLDILDSLGSANWYLEKICRSLLEMETTA
jgi:Na+/phosphate symporter